MARTVLALAVMRHLRSTYFLASGLLAACAAQSDPEPETATATAPLEASSCGPSSTDWPHLAPSVESSLAALPDAPAPTVVVPAVQRVGRLAGEASASQGVARYQMPLEVAPGRAGMRPELALVYGSAGGGELAGVGWTLTGVSRIHRCPRTPAHDGEVLPVRFDAADRLCLDGQRLVGVAGTYGAPGAEYRTERESFARIRQTGALADATACFTMEQKDGRIVKFGGCTDASAAQILPGPFAIPSTTNPLSWAVERIADRRGNELDFDYVVEDGEHLLRRIWYTGFQGVAGNRRVEIEYEPRSDIDLAYLQRAEVRSTRRLRAVTSFVDATLVRRYQLAYTVSPSTRRSLLASVAVCVGTSCTSSNSLPATTFAYQGEAPGFLPAPVPVADPERDRVIKVNDYDGDGTRETWKLHYPEPWGGGSPTTSVLELSSGPTFDLAASPWSNAFDNDADGSPRGGHVDFDNDGRVDLEGRINGAFAIASWNGTTKTFDTRTSNLALSSTGVVLARADFDADGRNDVAVSDAGNLKIRYQCPTSPAGHVDFCGSLDLGPTPSCHEIIGVSDYDGNGLPDLLWDDIPGLGGNCVGDPFFYFLRRANGSTWFELVGLGFAGGPIVTSLGAATGVKMLDINGDGLIDFFNLTSWTAWLNEGGTFRAVAVANPGANIAGREDAVIVADADQDGRAELLLPTTLTGPWCYLNWQSGDNKEPIEYCSGSSIHFNLSGAPRQHDHSIYQFDLLDLDMTAAGGVAASLRPTDLQAPLRRNGPNDWNGDGLTDIHFRIGKVYGQTRPDVTAVLGSYSGPAPANGAWVAKRRGKAPDLLTAVVDGLGASVGFAYAPLSSTGVSECADLFAPPFYRADYAAAIRDGVHALFASSMHVVARMERSNGVTTPTGTCFRYQDAWLHKRGRGFLTFGKIVENQDTPGDANDLRTTRTYYRDFPLDGRLQLETKQLRFESTAAAPIERTAQTWTYDGCTPAQPPAEPCNVFLDLQQVDVRDLRTRAQLGQTITDYVYDAVDRPYGNLSAVITTTSDTEHSHRVRTDYDYDYSAAGAWWIDRPSRKIETFEPVVATSGPAAPVVPAVNHVVTTDYEYWTSGNGVRLSKWQRVQNGDPAQAQATYTEYGGYGNPILSRIVAARATDRDTTYSYTTDGYFASAIRNPLNHLTQVETDKRFGKPTRVTDPNGLVITTVYDTFGRRTRTDVPGTTPVQERLLACTATTCPARAVLLAVTLQAGAATKTRYLDNLERPVRETVSGFDPATEVATDIEYDARGHEIARSQPSAGAAKYYTRYLDHDALGRPGKKTIDRSGTQPRMEIVYRYIGLDTAIEVPGTPAPAIRRHDSTGRLVRATDAAGGTTTYRYDPRGALSLIVDAAGNQTVLGYDARGRRTSLSDPDRGSWQFGYDGHGQLVTQIDARGTQSDFVYDRLGRPTSRGVTGQVEATWSYDGARIGAIDTERGGSDGVAGYCRGHDYDALGRPRQTVTFTGGQVLTTAHAYDATSGRRKGTAYPSGRVIGFEYTGTGYPKAEYDPVSGLRYRTITAMTPHGEIAAERFGNGVVGTYDRDPASWEAVRLRTEEPLFGQLPPIALQDLRYEYAHPFGELTRQTQMITGATETYSYDALLRLDSATRTLGSTTTTVDYGYDAIGNLKHKDDYAKTMGFGSPGRQNPSHAGPHAVVSYIDRNNALVTGFYYDSNGNQLKGDGRTITYDAFNLPRTIAFAGTTTGFGYAPDHARFRRTTTAATTYYVDKLHERIVAAAKVTQRDYIADRVVITRSPSGTDQVLYLHLDRLGSVDTTTDAQRTVIDRNGYDPYGGPRDAKWNPTTTLAGVATDRGFTQQEHVDDARVIHMNGRAYDYRLGRFLSTDPMIVDPTDSRCLDPYSYVRNDPLGRVDPTGFEDQKAVRDRIVKVASAPGTGSHIAGTRYVRLHENKNGDTEVYTLSPSEAKKSIAAGTPLVTPSDLGGPSLQAGSAPIAPSERSDEDEEALKSLTCEQFECVGADSPGQTHKWTFMHGEYSVEDKHGVGPLEVGESEDGRKSYEVSAGGLTIGYGDIKKPPWQGGGSVWFEIAPLNDVAKLFRETLNLSATGSFGLAIEIQEDNTAHAVRGSLVLYGEVAVGARLAPYGDQVPVDHTIVGKEHTTHLEFIRLDKFFVPPAPYQAR